MWRGECAAILAYLAHHRDRSREVHPFDSFEGLPEPVDADGPQGPEFAYRLAAPRREAEHLLFDLLNSIGNTKGILAPALPELRAVRYLLSAAEKAKTQYAYPQAVHFCPRALAAAAQAPDLHADKVRGLALLAAPGSPCLQSGARPPSCDEWRDRGAAGRLRDRGL